MSATVCHGDKRQHALGMGPPGASHRYKVTGIASESLRGRETRAEISKRGGHDTGCERDVGCVAE